MERKFIIPASTMFAGIIAWLIIFFTINRNQTPVFHELLLGIFAGLLIIVSAFACRRAGGPRAGSVFRAILLTIMAALSCWLVGITSGSILAASAIIVAAIALNTKETKTDNDSDSGN